MTHPPPACLARRRVILLLIFNRLVATVMSCDFYIPVFVTIVTVTKVVLKVDLVHLAGVDETRSRENRVRFSPLIRILCLSLVFSPLALVGTPEVRFLYQWRTLDHLVHIKAFCRTVSVPRNPMASRFPGAQNLTHLKLHPPNNELFGVPGASIFVHLGVGGFVTERSIGVPDFQV